MRTLEINRLKSLLHFSPKSGKFLRLVGRGKHHAGQIAGTYQSSGYIQITIDGTAFLAHRLAWFYVYEEWPDEIDHVNGDRKDNRISNLRSCTRSQNMSNRPVRLDSKSRVKGVSFHKASRLWRAQITFNKKVIHIGSFKNKEDAGLAYRLKSIELKGKFSYEEQELLK